MIDLFGIVCFCMFLLFLTITIILFLLWFMKYLQRRGDMKYLQRRGEGGEDDVTTTAETGTEKNPYADPCSTGAALEKASRFCPSCGSSLQNGVCENRLCSK